MTNINVTLITYKFAMLRSSNEQVDQKKKTCEKKVEFELKAVRSIEKKLLAKLDKEDVQ